MEGICTEEKVFYLLTEKFTKLVANITKINPNIEVGDCYMYVIEKAKFKEHYNDKNIYCIVKNRLTDFYRKVKKEKEIELAFNRHYKFANETLFHLSEEELCVCLYCVNHNYDKYLDMSFLARNEVRYRATYVRSILNKTGWGTIKADFLMEFENSSYVDFEYHECELINEKDTH